MKLTNYTLFCAWYNLHYPRECNNKYLPFFHFEGLDCHCNFHLISFPFKTCEKQCESERKRIKKHFGESGYSLSTVHTFLSSPNNIFYYSFFTQKDEILTFYQIVRCSNEFIYKEFLLVK